MSFQLFLAIEVPLLLVFLAFPLLLFAWIGKRVGTHPVCRKCGYNLTGQPDGVARCSECGSDLNRKGNTRRGDHRRRVVPVVLALLMAIGGVSALVCVDRNKCATAPQELTPTWWLLNRAKANGQDGNTYYFNQLVMRRNAGRLSAGEASSLTEMVLNSPGPGMLWSWCEIVEHAHINGGVSDAKWEQFWQQHTKTEMLIRSRACRNKPIPIRLTTWPLMLNIGSNFYHPWKVTLLTLDINGVKWKPAQGYPMANLHQWSGDPDEELVLPQEILDRLRDGPQSVSAEIEAHDEFDGRRQIHKTLSASFVFIAANAPSVALIKPDAATRVAISKTFSVTLERDGFGGNSVHMAFDCNHLPVNLYFKAFLMTGGVEHEMKGKIGILKGGGLRGGGPAIELDSPPPSFADLILRPDPEGALHTADFDEIWGEDIIFKNLPIN